MPFATNAKRCMFFVGGADEKANNDSAGVDGAGGCTVDFWNTKIAYYMSGPGGSMSRVAAKSATMDLLMNADGSGKFDGTGVAVSNGDTTYVTLDTTGIEAGMLAFCVDIGVFDDGPGIYEIIDVQSTYIELDADLLIGSGQTIPIKIGGAWDEIETPAENYIDASAYTQEIWINKDIERTVSGYSVDDWGHGDKTKNTFLVIQGFNRTPWDTTSPKGDSYQSIHDVEFGVLDTDSWVEIDMSAIPTLHCFDMGDSENVIISGMRPTGLTTGIPVYAATASYNNVIKHNVLATASKVIYLGGGINITVIDNHIESSNAMAFNAGLVVGLNVVNNIIVTPKNGLGLGNCSGCLIGNFVDSSVVPFIPIGIANFFSYGNTYKNGTVYGGFKVGGSDEAPSSITSINDIFLPTLQTLNAFRMGDASTTGYGSIYADNVCCYVPGVGELTDIIGNGYQSGLGFLGDDILEVDPLLDSENEPLEPLVRVGGCINVNGDPMTIGAVQVMNTDILNTAVQAAMTSQGYTPARGPKLDNLDQSVTSIDALVDTVIAKTDLLNFTGDDVKATLDSEAVKLASDGLNNVAITEPSGAASGWNFRQKLLWLVMRFLNKHTSDNFSGITVHKEDDTVSTTQPVTEASGAKTVGKVQ